MKKPIVTIFLSGSILISLLICEKAYSNFCEFKAKVTPEKYTERVKAIYEDTCDWFLNTFKVVPALDIPLNDVKFFKSWRGVEYVKYPQDLYGIFYGMHDKSTNEIALLKNVQSEHWKVQSLWLDSAIAHEVAHYLMKASSWDRMRRIDRIHEPIVEAYAYWSQDQYIRRHSDGKLTLNDFIVSKDEENVVDHFEFHATSMYNNRMGQYLFNAVLWFGTNPKGIFEGIVNGEYIMLSRIY